MKLYKYILLSFFSLLIVGCTPKAILISNADINTGKSFVINLMHLSGSVSSKNVLGTLFSGGSTAYNVDQVYLFNNEKIISSLNAASMGGANMAQIIAIPSGNNKIEVDTYSGVQRTLFGYTVQEMSFESDIIYVFVTEIEKSEFVAYLDVYQLTTQELKSILNEAAELSTFEFSDYVYSKLSDQNKILSNIAFNKKTK